MALLVIGDPVPAPPPLLAWRPFAARILCAITNLSIAGEPCS